MRIVLALVASLALVAPAFAGGVTEIDPSHDCAGAKQLDDYFPREPLVTGRSKYGDEYVSVGMRKALADLDGRESRTARDWFGAARGATAPTLDKQASVPVGDWMDRVPMERSSAAPDAPRADQNLLAAASRPIRQFGITKIVAEPAVYAMGGLLAVCFGAWLFGRRKTA